MSAVATPPAAGYAARLWRFSVAEFHALLRRGALPERPNVELLEGFLIRGEETNPPHAATLKRVRRAFAPLIPAGWDDRVQDAVTLADSEPLPDFVLVPFRADDYDTAHPGPADVGLLVEVADSSLADDRRDKGRIYARAGIRVYWIVNIPERQVEVYTAPDPAADPPAYRSRADYRPGDAVPVALDGAAVGAVPVADLLP